LAQIAPSENIKINWLNLTFSPEFEVVFQKNYAQNSLKQVRIALVLGLVVYACFGLLDYWLVPNAKYKLWFIRFAVVCPYLFILYLLSFTGFFREYLQLFVASAVLVGGLGITAMIVIAPYPASHSYYAGLILVFIYGYTFFRLRFIWATVIGWTVVLFYEIAAVGLSNTPLPILINNNFFFLTANVFGMFACYFIEYYLRKDFINAQLLEIEKRKVDQINEELENRVEERTAQLMHINEELVQEIAERKKSEKERRYLESQLRKSQKMEAIGTLAGGVAHDLNNILSGIVTYPELLLLKIPNDSFMRNALLTIKEAGQRAAAIVQDLLTLARSGVAVSEVVNLNEIIKEYLCSLEYQKLMDYHPNVEIQTELAEDLFNTFGSPIHISKTLMNLVSNAAEAMPSGGEILISTENLSLERPHKGYETVREGDYVAFTISDQGSGILQNDIERIFEPFYTNKKMGKSGTGLGMAVVWGTVKDHNGYIDVKTELHQGSSFKLYFPVTRKKRQKRKPNIALEQIKGNGESILVVDDIKEQREVATEILEKLGYRVESVSSGEEAVTYMKRKSADLLLLDMIMEPGIDGLETYKRILTEHPNQRAIIVSGFASVERIRQAEEIGIRQYVKKPYTMENIAQKVKLVLGELNAHSNIYLKRKASKSQTKFF
jgi:signal transduction histidine kinase/CheY-like chemotaxis protein